MNDYIEVVVFSLVLISSLMSLINIFMTAWIMKFFTKRYGYINQSYVFWIFQSIVASLGVWMMRYLIILLGLSLQSYILITILIIATIWFLTFIFKQIVDTWKEAFILWLWTFAVLNLVNIMIRFLVRIIL